MSVLVFSTKCSHCNDLVAYLKKHAEFNNLVSYHNINTHGIPPAFKDKIKSVPTLFTKTGKVLVGKEVKNWFESLLPNREISNCIIGGRGGGFCSLDDEDDNDVGFDINNYGQSLQPAMTPQLEARITRDVKAAYSETDPKTS